MKKKHIRFLYILVFIGAILGIALISIAAATPYTRSHADLAAAALYQPQAASPTPTATAPVSHIGSTDVIVLMGFVISAIILMPILFNKATWKKTQGDSD